MIDDDRCRIKVPRLSPVTPLHGARSSWDAQLGTERLMQAATLSPFKGCNMMQQKTANRMQSRVIESDQLINCKWTWIMAGDSWKLQNQKTRFAMMLGHAGPIAPPLARPRLCHVSWRGGMANPRGVSGKTSQSPLVRQRDTLNMSKQSNQKSMSTYPTKWLHLIDTCVYPFYLRACCHSCNGDRCVGCQFRTAVFTQLRFRNGCVDEDHNELMR